MNQFKSTNIIQNHLLHCITKILVRMAKRNNVWGIFEIDGMNEKW